MRLQFLILLALLVVGGKFSQAAVVKKATSKAILITHAEDRRWQKGDKACVYDGEKRLGCGKVVKVSKTAAMVKIKNKKKKIKDGQTVELYTPDIEDRMPASGGEIEAEIGKRQRKPFLNITVGASATEGLFNPYFNFQFAVSDHLAFGLRPHLFKLSNSTASLTSFGGYGTVNLYLKNRFEGLWVQAGAGYYLYSISETIGSNVEKPSSFAWVATAGWRLNFNSGFNIGLGAGVQALGAVTSSIAAVNFTGTRLCVNFDAGFAL